MLKKDQATVFTTKRAATLVAIVTLTTTVFFGFLYKEYHDLQKYMGYIAENGKSALFHEEYVNQRVAFTLSNAFSAKVAPVMGENDPATICQRMEHVNDVYGINLIAHTFPALPGTLQSPYDDCTRWADDIPELTALLNSSLSPSPHYSFSNYTGYTFDNLRYYVDLNERFVYVNRLIDSRRSIFHNWLVSENGNISIDRHASAMNLGPQALNDLRAGNNIVSYIYKDSYTGKNIISTINPVFANGKIKGVVVTDIDIKDLATSFYTPERPVLWSFLTMYLVDNRSKETLSFHQPDYALWPIIHYQEPITRYYTLNVCLDLQFFILSNLWALFIYVLCTLLLCQYARYYLNRHATLARDNITDPLTGLFNRKVMTAKREAKIHDLLARHIDVTVIAVDCDGLKKINDTLGHHMGDRAIKLLGRAIEKSIRKSDYGIRVGGDEFNIILVDADLQKASEVIARIEEKLKESDTTKLVAFSWGSYQMTPQDTFSTALIKADALLYDHKKGKYASRQR